MASSRSDLPERIASRTALVGVVGLGYVGLPLVRVFVEAGFRVLGFDADAAKVAELAAGRSYIGHIPSEWIAAGGRNRRVEATARGIAAALRPGQLVVLESTTYPGTTRKRVLPLLEASGLQQGRDFFLAYSPEREDPGNARYSAGTIP